MTSYDIVWHRMTSCSLVRPIFVLRISFQEVWLSQILMFKGWKASVSRESPGKFAPRILSRKILSVKIARMYLTGYSSRGQRCAIMNAPWRFIRIKTFSTRSGIPFIRLDSPIQQQDRLSLSMLKLTLGMVHPWWCIANCFKNVPYLA